MSMESSVSASSWPAMSSARYPSVSSSATTPLSSHPTYPLGKSRPCSTFLPAQLPSISSPGTTLGELETIHLSCWLGPGSSLHIVMSSSSIGFFRTHQLKQQGFIECLFILLLTWQPIIFIDPFQEGVELDDTT